MKKYLVIGDPVAHSLSPAMQNAAIRASGIQALYSKQHVIPGELARFARLARTALDGFNCTVPHKQAIMEHLDEIDPAALRAGSVNTVKVEHGRLRGFSTDGGGLEDALESCFKLQVAGSSFLLTGCGGAGRAVAFHLAARGAKRLFLFNRTMAKAEELSRAVGAVAVPGALADRDALRDALGGCDCIVQSTSCGLSPDDAPVIDMELLKFCRQETRVFEMIYRATPLLAQAAALGLKHSGGLPMLLHQGARSFELWFGVKPDMEAMRKALMEAAEK